ncbi:MAG: CDP-alcohol phosphatidyltransferase family protein [Lachnospiraceae bacterium]|nr:CDP-alcohol phosphatidyltransferase family protein [Ruminococcus sp.]MCM1276385.1 CDP-alcohol phosphatidyltransferase family protein [Lachnospiraceae bacterium]
MKNRIFTIPNILSFCRIILIPFIVISYLNGKNVLSAALLLLSAATDMLDGFIARKFDMISDWGKVLDPIADKLTMAAIIAAFCFGTGKINVAMLILFGSIVIKETAMGVEGIMVLRITKKPYSACWFGKAATVLLYAATLAHIVFPGMPALASCAVILLCEIAIAASLILYTRINVAKIRKTKNMKNKLRLKY